MRSIGKPFTPISRDIILYRDFYRLYDLAISRNPQIPHIETGDYAITENWMNLILEACGLSTRCRAYQRLRDVIPAAIRELESKKEARQ